MMKFIMIDYNDDCDDGVVVEEKVLHKDGEDVVEEGRKEVE